LKNQKSVAMTKKAVLTLIVLLVMTSLAAACPMCKDSIPNTDAQAAVSMPSAYNYSVYYMLGGLFLTLGLVLGVIVKGVRGR
jgi:hypothetical protein